MYTVSYLEDFVWSKNLVPAQLRLGRTVMVMGWCRVTVLHCAWWMPFRDSFKASGRDSTYIADLSCHRAACGDIDYRSNMHSDSASCASPCSKPKSQFLRLGHPSNYGSVTSFEFLLKVSHQSTIVRAELVLWMKWLSCLLVSTKT